MIDHVIDDSVGVPPGTVRCNLLGRRAAVAILDKKKLSNIYSALFDMAENPNLYLETKQFYNSTVVGALTELRDFRETYSQ